MFNSLGKDPVLFPAERMCVWAVLRSGCGPLGFVCRSGGTQLDERDAGGILEQGGDSQTPGTDCTGLLAVFLSSQSLYRSPSRNFCSFLLIL